MAQDMRVEIEIQKQSPSLCVLLSVGCINSYAGISQLLPVLKVVPIEQTLSVRIPQHQHHLLLVLYHCVLRNLLLV